MASVASIPGCDTEATVNIGIGDDRTPGTTAPEGVDKIAAAENPLTADMISD